VAVILNEVKDLAFRPASSAVGRQKELG
jgi:hypothetical protein